MDSIQSKYYIELFFEKKNKSDLNQNSQVDNNTSGKEKTQQILDQTIERYQSQGAVNILMDAENYETSSGLPTLKISGTLDISKTKKGEKVRCFFTTLIVDYEEGKVSLTLIYDKDDRYGDEISKKIIDSINEGCKIANCQLIGGETAEMKGIYMKDIQNIYHKTCSMCMTHPQVGVVVFSELCHHSNEFIILVQTLTRIIL